MVSSSRSWGSHRGQHETGCLVRRAELEGARPETRRSKTPISGVPIESLKLSLGEHIAVLQRRPADQASKRGYFAFGHAASIQLAFEATREKIDRPDLPYRLTLEHFVLGELRLACESILGRLAESSFRRRFDDREVVEPAFGEMRTGFFCLAQTYRKR